MPHSSIFSLKVVPDFWNCFHIQILTIKVEKKNLKNPVCWSKSRSEQYPNIWMSHILGCSWTPNVNLAPFQILWECEQFSGLKRPSSRGRGEGTWNFSFSSSDSLCWIPPGLGVCGGFYQFSRCCAPRLWGSAFPQTTATSSRQALGDFAVFLCLGKAPSHPLQPAVQHFLKDCPPVLRLLCPAGSLEVSHMHTFFFFFNEPLAFCLSFPSSSHRSLLFISHSFMCVHSNTVPLKNISTRSKASIWV